MSNGTPRSVGALLGADKSKVFGDRSNAVLEIEVAKLKPNPYQPRQSFKPEDIEDLANSIAAQGLLQPVIVARDPNDPNAFLIIAGERRVRAHEHLGKTTIRAIVTTWDEEKASFDALVENLQRVDLDPFELAQGVKQLMEQHGLGQEEVGKRLGKSRTAINRILRIGNLPAQIAEDNKTNPQSLTMLLQLAQLGSEAEQLAIWEQVKNGQITSRDQVNQQRKTKTTSKASGAGSKSATDKTLEALDAITKRMEKLAADNVTLNRDRLEAFEALYDRLSAALNQLQIKDRAKGE